jgi:MraZ protein
MALFLSTFMNKLDKKGRVSVPASFRAALAQEPFQGFIAFRSHKNQSIECCSYSRMEQLSQSVDTLALFSEEQDDFTATIFADSLQIPFDGDGRIVLPKRLADFIGVDEEVAFVGRGATFQLWTPNVFETMQQQARQRIAQSKATLHLTPASGGT